MNRSDEHATLDAIVQFALDSLPAEENLTLEQHAEHCAECAGLVAQALDHFRPVLRQWRVDNARPPQLDAKVAETRQLLTLARRQSRAGLVLRFMRDRWERVEPGQATTELAPDTRINLAGVDFFVDARVHLSGGGPAIRGSLALAELGCSLEFEVMPVRPWRLDAWLAGGEPRVFVELAGVRQDLFGDRRLHFEVAAPAPDELLKVGIRWYGADGEWHERIVELPLIDAGAGGP